MNLAKRLALLLAVPLVALLVLGGILEVQLRSIENHEYIVRLCDGSEHRSSRTYAGRLERWLCAG